MTETCAFVCQRTNRHMAKGERCDDTACLGKKYCNKHCQYLRKRYNYSEQQLKTGRKSNDEKSNEYQIVFSEDDEQSISTPNPNLDEKSEGETISYVEKSDETQEETDYVVKLLRLNHNLIKKMNAQQAEITSQKEQIERLEGNMLQLMKKRKKEKSQMPDKKKRLLDDAFNQLDSFFKK